MVALTALSPPPPRPSPSPAPPRRRPPPPAPHITSSPHGRSRPAIAVAAIAGGADDYHSTIRSLNSRGRHAPRKSLGQNYMLNSKVNEELVATAGVEAGDVVLEIGPGTGSLTAALLAAGATVFAVEKDQHMATLVKDRFGSTEQLKSSKTSETSKLIKNKTTRTLFPTIKMTWMKETMRTTRIQKSMGKELMKSSLVL